MNFEIKTKNEITIPDGYFEQMIEAIVNQKLAGLSLPESELPSMIDRQMEYGCSNALTIESSGPVFRATVGERMNFLSVGCIGAGGRVYKADAFNDTKNLALLMCLNHLSDYSEVGEQHLFALPGCIIHYAGFHFLKIGAPVWSLCGDGYITQDYPEMNTMPGQNYQIVGIALNQDTLYFYPQLVTVKSK